MPRSVCSTRTCLVSCKALYDYLTFHQFKELKELGCLWSDKQYQKFFILAWITLIYYFFVFGLYWSIVRNLTISFTGGGITRLSSARAMSIWDVLTPKLSDLWKQC